MYFELSICVNLLLLSLPDVLSHFISSRKSIAGLKLKKEVIDSSWLLFSKAKPIGRLKVLHRDQKRREWFTGRSRVSWQRQEFIEGLAADQKNILLEDISAACRKSKKMYLGKLDLRDSHRN